jgi:hypothetical protein
MKTTLETHSIGTLASRYRGLVARNTLASWIQKGRMVPVMTGKNGHFLFKTDYLDEVGRILERCHQQRVDRLIKNKDSAARIREQARRQAEAIIQHNERCEFSRKPHLKKTERNPALDDGDSVGATRFFREKPAQVVSVINCTASGKLWKGKNK